MRKLGIGLAIAIASVGAARAADLPTKKGVAAAPVNCFASVWTWLDSTAADCPLSYGPFTVYGTIDIGLGYNTNGAAYNAAWNNGVNSFITNAQPRRQMAVDAEWSQPVGRRSQDEPEPGPARAGRLVADRHGRDRIQSLLWLPGRRPALASPENGLPLVLQSANADSSRTGQWDNSQGFIGLSNKTYGTLTVGRVNTLSLDAINSYDPMGGSYAFSPLGFSGSFAGFGDTEAARANTAVKYRLEVPYPSFYGANFRVGGLVQWGGYDQGNGTTAFIRARPAPTSTCFRDPRTAASSRWTSSAAGPRTW